MRKICDVFIVVAAVSLVLGIISRLLMKPFLAIEAQAFLQFTQACLLFALVLRFRGPFLSVG